MFRILLLGAALLVAAPALAAPVTLAGEVTYRERIALPEDATLRIDLVDLALPDRPRLTVEALTGAGQVPLAFTFSFDDSLVLPGHAYALNAAIDAGGIRFRNTEPFPITPLAQVEPISILAQRVVSDSGEALPSSVEPPPAPVQLSLLDIAWEATMIGETPVPPGTRITLLIEPNMRAGGVGGCNSWFSQTTLTETGFSVGDLARTQRSCGYELNMLEQAYFEALRATRTWRVDNDTLTLLDGTGKPTITYER